MPKSKEDTEKHLLEQLAAAKKEAAEAKAALESKEGKEKQEKDPMSGPGILCEATKITRSEAWQLKSQEVLNPETQTLEMKTEPTPEGYHTVRGANNDTYVVKEPAKHVSEATLIPNCQSKYTREYTVKGPKAPQDRGNFEKEAPKVKVHLCEKHAKVFGAQVVK